jgi:hypothetical protein
MGEITKKYEKVEHLDPQAVPLRVYAERNNTNRSYVHIKYDRFKNGFIKGGNRYFGADPGYHIVTFHNTCYVIDNKVSGYFHE